MTKGVVMAHTVPGTAVDECINHAESLLGELIYG